jgi:hypothetical protein
MKLPYCPFLVFSLELVSLSWALDKPESYIRSPKSNNRELLPWDQNRCASQLAICDAAASLTELPYNDWMKRLDQLDGGDNGLYKEIENLVQALSLVDFSNLKASVETGAFAVATTILDLQSSLQDLSNAKAELETSDATADQLDGILGPIKFVVNFVQSTFGINLSPVSKILEVVSLIMAAIPQGPVAVLQVTISGVVTYLLPLVIDLLGQTIGVASICASAIWDCRFAQLALTVVPTLIGAAFIAQGYAIVEVEDITP